MLSFNILLLVIFSSRVIVFNQHILLYLASSHLTPSIHWPTTVLSMFMLSFTFVIVCDLFERKRNVHVSYSLFIYVLPLEIQLSRREGWDPINWFNSATLLCLSKARTWISNTICCCLFCVQWIQIRGDDCVFCWYWWSWWPSPFKLSFHNSNNVVFINFKH